MSGPDDVRPIGQDHLFRIHSDYLNLRKTMRSQVFIVILEWLAACQEYIATYGMEEFLIEQARAGSSAYVLNSSIVEVLCDALRSAYSDMSWTYLIVYLQGVYDDAVIDKHGKHLRVIQHNSKDGPERWIGFAR